MQRKIFIGVDLPAEVKKRLMQKMDKWKDMPIRWSKEENLHLTLAFLGHVDDELIYGICEGVREAAQEKEMFDVELSRIEIGPTQDEDAKLVRFSGEASEELKELVESIEIELGIFQGGKKIFKPHVTLGRVQKYNWQKLKKTPDISDDFSVLLPVESVQVFESAIVEGKRKFSVIDNCELSI
jgi:2'-5' RNA ligase